MYVKSNYASYAKYIVIGVVAIAIETAFYAVALPKLVLADELSAQSEGKMYSEVVRQTTEDGGQVLIAETTDANSGTASSDVRKDDNNMSQSSTSKAVTDAAPAEDEGLGSAELVVVTDANGQVDKASGVDGSKLATQSAEQVQQAAQPAVK